MLHPWKFPEISHYPISLNVCIFFAINKFKMEKEVIIVEKVVVSWNIINFNICDLDQFEAIVSPTIIDKSDEHWIIKFYPKGNSKRSTFGSEFAVIHILCLLKNAKNIKTDTIGTITLQASEKGTLICKEDFTHIFEFNEPATFAYGLSVRQVSNVPEKREATFIMNIVEVEQLSNIQNLNIRIELSKIGVSLHSCPLEKINLSCQTIIRKQPEHYIKLTLISEIFKKTGTTILQTNFLKHGNNLIELQIVLTTTEETGCIFDIKFIPNENLDSFPVKCCYKFQMDGVILQKGDDNHANFTKNNRVWQIALQRDIFYVPKWD